METWQLQAQRILNNYDIPVAKVELVRHNENLTCKVLDAEGNKFVLRIHQPIQGFSQVATQHSYNALCGEMEFIRAIGEGTDIAVQRPLRNKFGELVTQDAGVNATVLSWIEGETLSSEAEVAVLAERAYAVGIMAAKLHNFAATWKPAFPLHRLNYGKEKVQALNPIIAEGLQLGLITAKQCEIMQACCSKICQLMRELDERSGTKGMIHADLGKGNIIVHNGAVAPIDFCLSGNGYFYMDLGGMSADFSPLEVRQQLLKGYRSVRGLPEKDMKFIEGFFLLSILLFISIHLHNERYREWFGRRIQPICEDYIIPLLEDRRFYDNI